jgi:membrane-bound lytic murein transglycosylase B
VRASFFPARHLLAVAGLAVAILAIAPGGSTIAQAEAPSQAQVQSFLARLWPAARARGVSARVFEQAFEGFTPDAEVIALTQRQPELETTPGSYIIERVTPQRIETGRQMATEQARLLRAIEQAYGVDRHILLAIWGMESAYGANMGNRSIIRSLATLAMADARRANFWRKELLAALAILEEGSATPASFVGSWAGAMGHTQFIPTTFTQHAVDFDRDGRRDLFNSVADALASTASYLKRSGWTTGQPWGFEVRLPARFDYAWSAPGRARTLAEWLDAGVKTVAVSGNISLGAPLQRHRQLPRHPALQPGGFLCAGCRPSGGPHRGSTAAGSSMAARHARPRPHGARGTATPARRPWLLHWRCRRHHR